MANTTQDSTLLSDSTGKEVTDKVVESEGGAVEDATTQHLAESESSTPFVAGTDPHVESTSSQNSTNAPTAAPPSRPSLVPLGSNHPQSTPTAPHPKKFNAMNINKMFLEKNSSTSSASSAASTSSIAKSGSPVARTTAQPANSHSRLVTTKLTANPAVSSTAGWSRPSSAAPPSVSATNSPTNASPLPTATTTQPPTTAAPQLPHVGKVIQPQPRAAIATSASSQKDSGSSKPVWGNVKPPTIPIRPDIQPSDFPTAAEVANVPSTRRQPKQDDAKASAEPDSAARQARMEEADTFRGLHLDPNAHHWDEMEEDDDNFLGGVIEFGDGRQYKIESNEPQQSSSPHAMSTALQGDGSVPPSGPVSKEDRFVDDFDRSWPRSRPSPPSLSHDMPPSAAQSSSPVSPVISQAVHSPQDSSRVLFNERSNRLEPYSQSHRGQGPFSKRPNHPEGLAPLNDTRGSRDGPSNIHVLQKPGSDIPSHGRRFSGSGSGFSQASHFDRQKDREHMPRRDGPPPSPRLHRAAEAELRDREFPTERGRRTTMGPPPLPPHAMPKQAQDGGRQLPPHLTQVSPNVPPRRLPSRDSRFTSSETTPSTLPSLSSARLPSQSPVLSNASQVLVSPAAGLNVPLPLLGADMDEVQKDVMQSAAARAKQRRQQEEAEREAQKERARRKAVELEEKMKAADAEKAKAEEEAKAKAAQEKEALDIIENAARSVRAKSPFTENQAKPPPAKPSLRRPPSLKDLSAQPPSEALRSTGIRRSGLMPPQSAPGTAVLSSAAETDSWRSKANTLPRPTPHVETRPSAVPPASFITMPSAVEQIETIADNGKDELEVVDFSDMGKFVGAPEAITNPSESSSDVKVGTTGPLKPRPVASDFFDEPVVSTKQHDFNAWRRKVSQECTDAAPPLPSQKQKEETIVINEMEDSEASTIRAPSTQDQPRDASDGSSPDTVSKELLSLSDQSQAGQALPVPTHFNSQRSPRNQTFYKEAAMSALDDAMSRIKGALVGMHAQEPPKDVSCESSLEHEQPPTRSGHPPQASTKTTPKDRWVPPALRPRRFDIGDEPQEVFLVTIVNPPPSPSPTAANVKFPSTSRPVESIQRKQLQSFFRPPYQPRFDILSFDPPVQGMDRRTLSLNEVLFRPQGSFRFRYRVMLPRTRGPKVHIPANTLTRTNGVGAFGRPTPAEGATSWRKPVVLADDSELPTGLNTMSRSPPPEATTPKLVTSIPKSSDDSPSKSDNGLTPVRSRSQPKMPAGSAVAFYRDSRIDVVEADIKPSVNFTVGSELDDSKTSQEYLLDGKAASSPRPLNGTGLETTSESAVNTPASISRAFLGDKDVSAPVLTSTKSESKSSDDSTDRILATPPNHHNATWARASVSLPIKESPARAPDPEHLKALWAQNTNKTTLHPVNSLEGIADDLTALPFTLQDVKSEDGETPPPSLPSAPSRMSLHEVTRAFQQVPAPPSSSNQAQHRVTISPPSTNAPVARPTYAYSPLSPNNMRPAYPSYGSPLMSPSPAPVMYHPSPVPSRMQPNGHQPMTPVYGQHVWMTMGGPPSQNNMMRPVTSPYQAPMMAYGSPGYAPQPSTGLMPATTQGQNGGGGRGMPVLSPVMSHAHAHAHPMPNMYGGSPVLLHPTQQGHSYVSPIPPGRGQPPRAENGHGPQQPPHSTQGVHHPASHPSFNPSSSFVRPGW